MLPFLIIIFGILALVSRRAYRYAYVAYVLFGLLWIPWRTHFHLVKPVCEGLVGTRLMLFSLTNYRHIELFAFLFVITCLLFTRPTGRGLTVALFAVLAIGLVVELEEGATRTEHCMRDLVPDAAGALVGMTVVLGGSCVAHRFRERKNGVPYR